MKNTIISITLGALFAFIIPTGAATQPNDSATMNHHQKMMADPTLSADQKTKIQALHKDMEEKGKPLFDQMKSISDKVKVELLKDQPSKPVLDEYATQIADIQKQLLQKRYDHVLRVKAILTKEQFITHLNHEWMGPQCAEKYKGMHGGHGCPMSDKKGEAMGKGGHGCCKGHEEGKAGN